MFHKMTPKHLSKGPQHRGMHSPGYAKSEGKMGAKHTYQEHPAHTASEGRGGHSKDPSTVKNAS